jgi:hypothetical protein
MAACLSQFAFPRKTIWKNEPRRAPIATRRISSPFILSMEALHEALNDVMRMGQEKR